ncbi:MAG TPA: glycerol-3-phosphate responsive antiterminator [Candidatus Limnocylindria bacterium]
MAEFVARLKVWPCCAAVVSPPVLEQALASEAPIVFILRGDGLELRTAISRIQAAGKLAAVHLDLVDGLSADTHGVAWLARSGADAIITSHGRLVPAIRREGCLAIHRILVSRRGHLDSAMKAAASAAPDVLEVLPGIVLPSITQLVPRFGIPMLAGGFIRSADDVRAVMAAGARGVTTSEVDLWGTSL